MVTTGKNIVKNILETNILSNMDKNNLLMNLLMMKIIVRFWDHYHCTEKYGGDIHSIYIVR